MQKNTLSLEIKEAKMLSKILKNKENNVELKWLTIIH